MSQLTTEYIADIDNRTVPESSLIGKTILMNFNRKKHRVTIIGSGTRVDMLKKATELNKNGDQTNEVTDMPKAKASSSMDKNASKKAKLDSVLATIIRDEGPVSDKDTQIFDLQMQLEDEKENHTKTREKLHILEQAMNSMENDSVDVGHKVFVKKETISAFKSVSPKCNIFDRYLFRYVLETHETVARSLFGKKCNANKSNDSTETVNETKRDAVIEHSLKTFKYLPGTELYEFALGALKHRLSNLVAEVNRSAKELELQAAQMALELDAATNGEG